jgi:hypothetical protein
MTTGPDWADQARRLLDSLRGGPAAGAPGGGTTEEHPAGECTWCPHCQVLAVLRGDRPEVTAVLGDVLTTVVAALRQFAGEAPDPSPTPAEPAEEDPAADAVPVVQRIEIA